MSIGLLYNCDKFVASTAFATCKLKAMPFDCALGLVKDGNTLKGAVIFQNYNGSNVEFSYYGQNALTPGIVKCLARFVIEQFDASRVTVTVSKRRKHLQRVILRFGFRLEGTQRCYYGKKDTSRNTGVRFVMFRDRIDQLARLTDVQLPAPADSIPSTGL
jgi:hypothetical protein